MNAVKALLQELGLEQYIEHFVANDIDGSLLNDLTSDDLKEIGVASLGHRKRIINAIAANSSALPEANSTPLLAPFQGTGQTLGGPAERRRVTTVFADLTAYTRLSRELDTEDMLRVLTAFYDRLDNIVQRLGGLIERHIGDCVMAVFGAPVSYGNDTEHALRAAGEIHAAMAELTQEFEIDLGVHIGVAAGNVLFSAQGRGALRKREFTLTGDSVNLAARLADLAKNGQTLITESIYNELGDSILCDQPGSMSVKGFDSPVPVRRFIGFSVRSGSRPLIGRKQELASFAEMLRERETSGHGGVMALIAEAGLGKTRLIEEFELNAASLGYVVQKSLVLDFGIAAAQNPIRTLLGALCGVSELTETFVKRELIGRLAASDDTDLNAELFLAEIFGVTLNASEQTVYNAMTDEARSAGRSRAMQQLLRSQSRAKPLLLVLEDVHWADAETLKQIALIAAETAISPILLVMTLRPENSPLDSILNTSGADAMYRLLELSPLGDAESTALAQQTPDPPSAEVLAACVARAEGNPLFLDQLLRHASEASSDALPGSIQSIVQARLDRLAPLDRKVLAAAAIIGQRFTIADAVVLANTESYKEWPLLDASLIRPVKQGYLFTHALIRDVVLRTILRDELRGLHLKAAALFRGTDAILYAEHLAAATDPGAADAFLEAARESATSYRKELALALAERGLALTTPDPARLSLLNLKGEMLRDLGQGAESIAAFEAALEIATNPVDHCRAQIGIVAAMRIMDRIDDAYALLDEVQQVAEKANLQGELSEIHYFRGSLHFPRGDLNGCLLEHGQSLAFAESSGLHERRALALSGLGDAHYARGRMFTAHDTIERCLDVCKEHGLIAVEAANRFMLATVKIYMNDTANALEEARASVQLAAGVGHTRAEIVSRLTASWLLTSMDRNDEASAEVASGLDLAVRLGARRFVPFLKETQARIALAAGDRQGALKLVNGALDELRELDAMSFIGPWLLSTAARATDDAATRRALLAEGENLLAKGCLGHNYFRFYRNAIEASLVAGEWDVARRYADALEAYALAEPTPWSDYHINRARALADLGDGDRDDATSRLTALRDQAKLVSLLGSVHQIEEALQNAAHQG